MMIGLQTAVRCATVIAGVASYAIAYCCCGISTKGQLVSFTGQSNIIVWDPETNTEHFIRNAKFDTQARDLGFITPTPTVPKIEEVDPKAFETLASLEPPPPPTMGCAAQKMDSTPAGAVEVVQIQDVAGFRATTLRADDPASLAKWMKSNGYATTPAIENWSKFYLDKKWLLTAFKVINGAEGAQTGLVKMSFRTDRPFNPYFVPADNLPANESTDGLMLFFIGPGEFAPERKEYIHLRKSWTNEIDDTKAHELCEKLKLPALPDHATVTYFTDLSFPNGDATDDAYFVEVPPSPPNWTMAIVTVLGSASIAVFLYLRRIRRV